LLYWDGIATIVPTDYLENPSQFSPFALDLVRDGIIETVQPEEYVYAFSAEYDAFLSWAEQNAERLSNDRRGNVRQFNIHIGKLGAIGHLLEEMGLSRRVDDRWYEMSERLSMAFMTFLAVLIGRETDYIPATDSLAGISSIFSKNFSVAGSLGSNGRDILRNSILENILPVPKNVTDYREIVNFKEHYYDELTRFRLYIEDFLASIDGASAQIQQERCRNFLIDANEQIEEIKGHMRYFRTPHIDVGTIIVALPSMLDAIQGEFGKAALGFGGVICEMVYNRDRRNNRRKPLAYAALYNRRLNRFSINERKLQIN
ncbi:MAG: hypothetical protein IJ366_08760, partial [Clostridia bacterium]|nr:hypothetical protein [Clostridia bacterium]